MQRTQRDKRSNGKQLASIFRQQRHAISECDWFAQACLDEDAGRLHQAMRAYRQALAGGPSAVCSFNLANVFYGLRRKVEAANYFQLAVQLDPYWHEAWNNLGVVLCELRNATRR